jgi:hypothetical protein
MIRDAAENDLYIAHPTTYVAGSKFVDKISFALVCGSFIVFLINSPLFFVFM